MGFFLAPASHVLFLIIWNSTTHPEFGIAFHWQSAACLEACKTCKAGPPGASGKDRGFSLGCGAFILGYYSMGIQQIIGFPHYSNIA